MAELIAPTTAAAVSADFVLAAGASRTLNMKATPGSTNFGQFANINIQIKTGTDYVTLGNLSNVIPVQVLQADGTFRLQKDPTSVAVGADGS